MTIRFIKPADTETLRRYFDGLARSSRYNRFLGATEGLSQPQLDRLFYTDAGRRFGVLAEIEAGDARIMIAEALYAFDTESRAAVEFGLSVADKWRRRGVGSALLANLECRAAALGADHLFGDTFAANQEMLGLARSRGYRFTRPPADWTLVRFKKDVRVAHDTPCRQSSRAVRLLAAAH